MRSFVGLTYVWFALWFLAPAGIMLLYAFGHTAAFNQQGLVNLHHLGLSNFFQALRYPTRPVLVVSLENAVLATALCGLLAYPVAYFIARKLGPRSRTIVLLLVVLPFWTDYLLRMIGWRIFLSPLGILYGFLHALGWHVGYLTILDTRTAVMIGLVYNYIPLFILPLAVVLERIDPQLLQAADDLGGKPWTIFRTVTFPISMSGVVAGTILVFVPMLGDYVTPTIMGGARGLMVGSLVASEFNEGQNWSLGAAMAILLVLLLVGVVALVWMLTVGVQFARSHIRQRTLNREWVK